MNYNSKSFITIIAGVLLVLMEFSCSKKNNNDTNVIEYGSLVKNAKMSDLISDCRFIKLETDSESLLGSLDQVEIYKDKIIILDNYKAFSVYMFSIEGKFIQKMGPGEGPGSFVYPGSFWLDGKGNILILDMMLDKLLKYKILDDKFQFVEEIKEPSPHPVSFAELPGSGLFAYYYPIQKNSPEDFKQYIVADKTGKVRNSYYRDSISGKFMNGNMLRFYRIGNEVKTIPFFSSKIYSIDDKSMNLCYNASWGNASFPDDKFFVKYDFGRSAELGDKLFEETLDWIRCMYAIETPGHVFIKYYKGQDGYISVFNKGSHQAINVKNTDIQDNLGIGGEFPEPRSTFRNDHLVGYLEMAKMDKDKIRNGELKKMIAGLSEDDNPIVIIFKLK